MLITPRLSFNNIDNFCFCRVVKGFTLSKNSSADLHSVVISFIGLIYLITSYFIVCSLFTYYFSSLSVCILEDL